MRKSGSVLQTAYCHIRLDTPLYLAIIAYTVCALLLLNFAGAPELASHYNYFLRWGLIFLVVLPALSLALDAAYVIHRFDQRRMLAFRRMFSTDRIARLLAGMALLGVMVLFQGSFTTIKNILPVIQGGFLFDQTQADIDRWLHFGTDPWQHLYDIAAYPIVRTAIEWNYLVLWFVLNFGALFFVVTSSRATSIRTRYLIAFMLVWIICGNVLAGFFISAGPAFYGAVTGDSGRFAEQLAFLAQSAGSTHSALAIQNDLWSLHIVGQAGFGSGISAFPSVHVALVTLNAFFLFDYSRRLGLAAFGYVTVICISSVYLGWHYAIDGYVSIIVVALVHFVLKRIMQRQAVTGTSKIAVHATAPSTMV